ncbi:Twitching mobility protein [compost metagenome]
MSLTELLLQAKAKKAQQFLFVVGSEPRAKINSSWVSLRKSPALVTEWNLLQQSFLNGQQKAMLDTRGVVVGEAFIESTRFGFSFFQSETTMKAVLQMDSDGGKQELAFPPSVMESCLRMKGLVILSGPGDAGQTLAVHRLLQKLNEERSFLGVVFSQKMFPQIREEKGSFVYQNYSLTEGSLEGLMSGADVVVFDGVQSDEEFIRAMEFAEKGLFVICSMAAPTMGNTLRRAMSAVSEAFSEMGVARLSEVLSLCVGQYAMAGLGGDQAYAHEVLLVTPQVRHLIEHKDVRGIESLLKGAPENSGLISLNQSLLQNLIRRKVDIKTAFEVSQDPDGLDLLLKKVGI